MYTSIVVIAETPNYKVTSFGRGAAYPPAPGGRKAWLDHGDETAEFEHYFNKMELPYGFTDAVEYFIFVYGDEIFEEEGAK